MLGGLDIVACGDAGEFLSKSGQIERLVDPFAGECEVLIAGVVG